MGIPSLSFFLFCCFSSCFETNSLNLLSIYHLEDEYQEDLETFVANAPSRIVQRQREQATMFGMPKWKSQVRKKALEERSPAVREILVGHDIHPDFELIEKVEAEVCDGSRGIP